MTKLDGLWLLGVHDEFNIRSAYYNIFSIIGSPDNYLPKGLELFEINIGIYEEVWEIYRNILTNQRHKTEI